MSPEKTRLKMLHARFKGLGCLGYIDFLREEKRSLLFVVYVWVALFFKEYYAQPIFGG